MCAVQNAVADGVGDGIGVNARIDVVRRRSFDVVVLVANFPH